MLLPKLGAGYRWYVLVIPGLLRLEPSAGLRRPLEAEL
jgi:hypothetical protein